MPEMSSKIFIRMQIFFTKNQTNTLNQNLTVYAFMQNPNRTLLDLTGQAKKGTESFSGQDFQRKKLAMQMLKVIEEVAAM